MAAATTSTKVIKISFKFENRGVFSSLVRVMKRVLKIAAAGMENAKKLLNSIRTVFKLIEEKY